MFPNAFVSIQIPSMQIQPFMPLWAIVHVDCIPPAMNGKYPMPAPVPAFAGSTRNAESEVVTATHLLGLPCAMEPDWSTRKYMSRGWRSPWWISVLQWPPSAGSMFAPPPLPKNIGGIPGSVPELPVAPPPVDAGAAPEPFAAAPPVPPVGG